MKTITKLWQASLVGASAFLPLQSGASASESRVEAITLSSGGLAEVNRSARVSGNETVEIEIPLEQVDDILKSLVVRDPSGKVGGLTLDGLSPVEETFRRLPFGPDTMGSLPDLAASLQGVSIRATSGGRTVEGVVLGVGSERRGSGPEASIERILSVMTGEGGIDVLKLGTDTTLEILDEAMREKLREAAAVSGRGRIDDMRRIAISLSGKDGRDIALSYVVPAPVWKTAYRLVSGADGQARLQAWAIIENATGEDWKNVAVTLSSGAPVTLSQRLHQRYWHQRPEIPVTAGATTPPRPDNAASINADMSADAGGGAMLQKRMRTATPASAPVSAEIMTYAPMAGAREQTVAQEGQTSASFRLPDPVNLRAGQTLSMPFIDAEVPAEQVSLFQPERGEAHPIAALLLENGTGASLPPGILTVYDGRDGYVGDAQLAGIPATESRMVSFAADRKVEIASDTKPEEAVTRIRVVDGALLVTSLSRLVTTYSIKGAADGARTVIIEHPRQNGWRVVSDALSSSTPTHHRLRVEIGEGASKDVVVTAEQDRTDRFALVDAGADALLSWSGAAADPETASKLAELGELRRKAANAQNELRDIEDAIERTADAQGRIRDNLAAAPADSALAKRYLGMLEKTEDEIAALTGRRDEMDVLRKRFEADVSAFVRDF
ncbi:hypothetical protein NA8A_08029 [Nitratireductor indicus C115]|uniref:DUF4139 domain-containing protein n=1 Tax=Nitratireductor indicus C115 TaxID=1231190 RepID=K2NZC5_9HYPH|nr:DUF4139 domain-containing protein [Nitratireductor indicus]EKF43269.1 hypothetical protein NA8A_08029 [Nitratireductor indicus C115]SFQ54258.1 protein of unknown function [Nitratireductor indicus]